ncbi:MAG: branched-chain amino acid ABC transporter substrate-binding protein [Pseudomonadota bacterium]
MILRAFVAAFAATLVFSLPAHAQLKFGLGAPMTGEQATFGAQMKSGAELAIEDINANGGLLGEKVELTIGDDRADPKEGLLVANKFIGQDIRFLVGHLQSGVSIPASKEYADNGILTITPGATNPQLTDNGLWNSFRVCGRDDQQGAVAGNYIADNFKGKKIVVLHDRTPYGKGLADETLKAMKAKGMDAVFYDGINVQDKDFSAVVSRIKQEMPDYVYFGGLHTPAGLLVRQMREQGVLAHLISGDGIVTEEFAAIAGPGAEGTLMTFGPDPEKNPAAAKVIEKFKAKNLKPESYAIYTYAGYQLLAEGIKAANSTDAKKVAEVFHSGKTFDTVLGPLSFDKKGDLSKPNYVMYEWVKDASGKIVYRQKNLSAL